ncbi:flavin reductase [Rhodococcus erythropolis]|uniref:flavin reductase n=1 Tax=Rhodococcus erythropolis TaxID=1833 RepID=UPI000A03AEDE|nr:flavin reductase [Rhodococcus erythropolis]ORI29059.1 flavin reductase [Rhodococcus erythropolis]
MTTKLVGTQPVSDVAVDSAPSIRSAFVEAFRNHPAGVSIITATGDDGPAGITSSSVISISADPAVLAFSLQSLRGSASVIASASSFVVHLANSANEQLAATFATRGAVRFGDDMRWSFLSTGEPFLHGTGHALRAVPLNATTCGSAVIVTARVVDVIDPQHVSAPLVYHDRTYRNLSSHNISSKEGMSHD